MPAARQLESPEEQQERLRLKADHQLNLDELEQELALYDPSGPWRFFEKRLRDREARAQTALETGAIEDVAANRAVLKAIRDLLDVPAELQRSRELLLEGEVDE